MVAIMKEHLPSNLIVVPLLSGTEKRHHQVILVDDPPGMTMRIGSLAFAQSVCFAMMNRLVFLGFLCGIASRCSAENATDAPVRYGVDVSWPMHYGSVSTNYPWLPHNLDPSLPVPEEYVGMPIQPLGDKQKEYLDYMQSCVDYYDKKNGKGQRCWDTEYDRLTMTLRQPKSMYNYTKLGFTKIRAPDKVFQLLKTFWDKNKHKKKPERWTTGNIYTNHWQSPSYMVSVEDTDLDGGGYVLKQHVWNAARDTIQEWTGHKLAECSLYGIRIYTEGAVLAPHVDRNPLVSSAIINVDQDVDEPWPLEVIGHDGMAYNVTMEPGDLVLYESHSIIHGRQFPLKGRFMSNIFIHFEPIGPIDGAVLVDGDLPPYLIPGSEEEPRWRANNPNGHTLLGQRQFTTGSTDAHEFAQFGDVESLTRYLDEHPEVVEHRDKNGWTPLAEGIRSGKKDVVELLLDRGSEVNAQVGKDQNGPSMVRLAIELLGTSEHEVIDLLVSRGGRDFTGDQAASEL